MTDRFTSDHGNALVHDGLMRWAQDEPSRPAIIMDRETVSFGDLHRRSTRFAVDVDRLQARRVGLCLTNSSTVIEVFIGTLMAGGCVCLFDPSWPVKLIQELIEDHAPQVFVASAAAIEHLSTSGESSQCISEDDLTSRSGEDVGAAAFRSVPTPDMPFLIGFTSGTSGKPKAFIRSHRTWIESFAHSAVELGTNSKDVVVAPGPLSHGLSLYAVIEAINAGATAVIHSTFDTTNVIESLYANQATMLVAVPSMLDLLVGHRHSGQREMECDTLSRIVTAGSKLSPRLRSRLNDAFPNADIIEYYGASELSFITTAKGSDDCPAASVGRAFSGVDIDVRDAGGISLPQGEAGTIWVRSRMVSDGYVGPTDGSGFRADGAWATVGDIGHLDEGGFLYLDGREGTVITSAGYTVYPSAIEAVLMSHPDIIDAAVFGLPDPRWGEVIAAVVSHAPNAQLSEDDLAGYCLERLEPYACPRRWKIADTLERTSSGKVRQVELEDLFD